MGKDEKEREDRLFIEALHEALERPPLITSGEARALANKNLYGASPPYTRDPGFLVHWRAAAAKIKGAGTIDENDND